MLLPRRMWGRGGREGREGNKNHVFEHKCKYYLEISHVVRFRNQWKIYSLLGWGWRGEECFRASIITKILGANEKKKTNRFNSSYYRALRRKRRERGDGRITELENPTNFTNHWKKIEKFRRLLRVIRNGEARGGEERGGGVVIEIKNLKISEITDLFSSFAQKITIEFQNHGATARPNIREKKIRQKTTKNAKSLEFHLSDVSNTLATTNEQSSHNFSVLTLIQLLTSKSKSS